MVHDPLHRLVLQAPQRPQRVRRPVTLLVLSATALISLITLPRVLTAPETEDLDPPADVSEELQGQGLESGLEGFLGGVQEALQPLEEEVEQGKLVSAYGQKADSLLQESLAAAGEAGPHLKPAVDGMLQTLFLRQLTLLRQQLAFKFEKGASPVDSVTKADEQFVAAAEELKRPGSDWSYDQERYALRAVLEGGLKREAALAEESQTAAHSQQATVEVISKLQNQMESLQQKVQAMRAGSPWFMSASWRIPRTPFNLIARHQQGRTNLEFSLNQDRDPANSEAGMVQGFGPMNLGVNLNVGT